MPQNKFPDSLEKRELRRRDLRHLRQCVKEFGRKLDYCGLPSIEFLDVDMWRGCLASVVAFESEQDSHEDMKIEQEKKAFPFPVEINPRRTKNILDHLINGEYCYDLYNLDFFQGFVYPDKSGKSKSTEAIRQLFSEQAGCERSFVLIATLNARDTGGDDYKQFFDSVTQELKGKPNGIANIRAHNESHMTMLKLAFPFYCWQQAHVNGFDHYCDDVIMYRSSATFIHFLQMFRYKGTRLPSFPGLQPLIELANRPLFEMKKQVVYRRTTFPLLG
jgi:hypothetical protein